MAKNGNYFSERWASLIRYWRRRRDRDTIVSVVIGIYNVAIVSGLDRWRHYFFDAQHNVYQNAFLVLGLGFAIYLLFMLPIVIRSVSGRYGFSAFHESNRKAMFWMLIVLAVLVLIQAGDEGNIDSWWAIPIGAAAVGVHKLGNVFPQPD